MREKLLDLMKNEGLKPSQLAEMLEINPAGISHILAGRNKPGFDLLQKILRRFPRINPDWLLLDSDKMYRDEFFVAHAPATQAPRPADEGLFGSQHISQQTAQPGKPEKSEPETILDQPIAARNISRGSAAGVARVVIFYEDQTFESYIPSKRE